MLVIRTEKFIKVIILNILRIDRHFLHDCLDIAIVKVKVNPL